MTHMDKENNSKYWDGYFIAASWQLVVFLITGVFQLLVDGRIQEDYTLVDTIVGMLVVSIFWPITILFAPLILLDFDESYGSSPIFVVLLVIGLLNRADPITLMRYNRVELYYCKVDVIVTDNQRRPICKASLKGKYLNYYKRK
ncbi:MAG: hypothetical protein IH840_16210 [Candidatus Heimdallarchaeota archaeon]|nr:hypothetical protein [Candidatus Heimdallarchaeota archaeon]